MDIGFFSFTREGNTIFPRRAAIRAGAHGETLCRYCVHFADLCKDLKKTKTDDKFYVIIATCEGYEEIK